MKKAFKYLSIWSVAAVIIMMAAATVIEKLYGTTYASDLVYHNPLFVILWAVAAISGIIMLIQRRTIRKVATFMLHISLVLILAGALTTMLTGRQGMMHLRLDQPMSEWASDQGFRQRLPFTLSLTDFTIEYYAGSKAPSDYSSTVQLTDKGTVSTHVISMNNILRYRGYRFYQADYDQDREGSFLSVSHDPWGVTITYIGYAMLLLSMLSFFIQKDSGFRRALRNIRERYKVIAILALSTLGLTQARAANTLPPVLPDSVAEQFSELYIYYNDRIAPLQTMARDYSLKAYGKNGYEGYSATQVITGWLFYYDWWNVVPLKLKAKEMGTSAQAEKESIRMEVATGQAFRIFPLRIDPHSGQAVPAGGQIVWFGPDDPLPDNLDYDTWVFIRRSLDYIRDEIRNSNWADVNRTVKAIRSYQVKTAAEVIPSDRRFRAEIIHNGIARPMVPFMASITIGMILFVIGGMLMARRRDFPVAVRILMQVLTTALFLYLTLVLGLRWYISGHAPLAGSYSVMMLMAWLVTIAMTVLRRSLPIIQPMGFILAGFTMLVASLASSNPQITHLMPVLQSPLLSLHVLCMMVSYTLFGLVALTGIMGLIQRNDDTARMLRDVNLTILYPAVFILTTGTFLGAVWANVSWGSYWSWDPKETWALITMLVYSAMLHSSVVSRFNNPRFFHLYSVLAFLTVLITYFGVNLILGGMHAYA